VYLSLDNSGNISAAPFLEDGRRSAAATAAKAGLFLRQV